MTNLLTFASVAKKTTQLLLTVARLRLLLVMFLTLCVSAAWGAIEDGTYKLVSSTSELIPGSHYVIASGTSGDVYCISNVSNTNNRKTVAATATSNQIIVESTSTIMTFTLGGSSNAWTFSTDNYAGTAGLLAATSSSNNRLGIVASPGDNGKWAIDITDNVAYFVAQGTYSRKYIQYNYNNGTPLFNAYSSVGTPSTYLYKKVTAAYTITATSNNTDYGTVSVSGTTITATPEDGYRVKSGDAGYTVTDGTADVINNGDNTFSVTPSSNCTITINFEAIPKYTVNWYVNGSIEHSQTDIAGATLTNIPNLEDYECEGKAFVGWTTQSSYEHATNAPTDLITNTSGLTMPENGANYYAVFAEASGDGEDGWQKVTSTDQVKDGEMYAFISFDEAYYLANALSTSDPIVKAVSKTNGILNVTNEMKWIASANSGGFEFKSYSNNDYYLWGGSANDAIRINTTSAKANATKVWYTKILNTYGVVIYHNASTDGAKYLATNGSSNWRNYLDNGTLGNTNRVANLYKFTSGTTYSNYTTQCSTETLVSVLPKIMNFWQSIFRVSLGYLWGIFGIKQGTITYWVVSWWYRYITDAQK